MIKYCKSTYKTKRWKTREVMVGEVGVGGNNPIRIQSMTTSNTRDIEATIDQIIRLADAGCEIARVTVQGMKKLMLAKVLRVDFFNVDLQSLLLQISIFSLLLRCVLLILSIRCG